MKTSLDKQFPVSWRMYEEQCGKGIEILSVCRSEGFRNIGNGAHSQRNPISSFFCLTRFSVTITKGFSPSSLGAVPFLLILAHNASQLHENLVSWGNLLYASFNNDTDMIEWHEMNSGYSYSDLDSSTPIHNPFPLLSLQHFTCISHLLGVTFVSVMGRCIYWTGWA